MSKSHSKIEFEKPLNHHRKKPFAKSKPKRPWSIISKSHLKNRFKKPSNHLRKKPIENSYCEKPLKFIVTFKAENLIRKRTWKHKLTCKLQKKNKQVKTTPLNYWKKLGPRAPKIRIRILAKNNDFLPLLDFLTISKRLVVHPNDFIVWEKSRSCSSACFQHLSSALY